MPHRVFEFLFANPDRTMATAGIFLAVISLILSYYFYTKSKNQRKLAMQYNHIALIDNKNGIIPSEIEIRYKGDVIGDLRMYKATIWNSGNREIRQSDFIDGYGVELEVSQSGRALSAEILNSSSEKLCAEVSISGPGEGKIKITFHVLEPNDGFTIKVLHSKKGRMDISFPIMGLAGWKIFDKQKILDKGEKIFVHSVAFTAVASSVAFFIFFPTITEIILCLHTLSPVLC